MSQFILSELESFEKKQKPKFQIPLPAFDSPHAGWKMFSSRLLEHINQEDTYQFFYANSVLKPKVRLPAQRRSKRLYTNEVSPQKEELQTSLRRKSCECTDCIGAKPSKKLIENQIVVLPAMHYNRIIASQFLTQVVKQQQMSATKNLTVRIGGRDSTFKLKDISKQLVMTESPSSTILPKLTERCIKQSKTVKPQLQLILLESLKQDAARKEKMARGLQTQRIQPSYHKIKNILTQHSKTSNSFHKDTSLESLYPITSKKKEIQTQTSIIQPTWSYGKSDNCGLTKLPSKLNQEMMKATYVQRKNIHQHRMILKKF